MQLIFVSHNYYSCLPAGIVSPAAVVVPAHEHLTAAAADSAVGLVAVVVVLIRALQEAVLQRMRVKKKRSEGRHSTIIFILQRAEGKFRVFSLVTKGLSVV